jgi:DNA-binding response OmpR family regulator
MWHVLVVDDDMNSADTLAKYFQVSGHRASACYSGQAALGAIGVTAFDAVVLDLRLGDLDGLDILRNLRSRGLTTPVVILTGFGTIASAVEAT